MVVELEVEERRQTKSEIQKTEFVWMNGKIVAWDQRQRSSDDARPSLRHGRF